MNLPINDIRYGLRMILKAPAVRVSSSHFADRLLRRPKDQSSVSCELFKR